MEKSCSRNCKYCQLQIIRTSSSYMKYFLITNSFTLSQNYLTVGQQIRKIYLKESIVKQKRPISSGKASKLSITCMDTQQCIVTSKLIISCTAAIKSLSSSLISVLHSYARSLGSLRQREHHIIWLQKSYKKIMITDATYGQLGSSHFNFFPAVYPSWVKTWKNYNKKFCQQTFVLMKSAGQEFQGMPKNSLQV